MSKLLLKGYGVIRNDYNKLIKSKSKYYLCTKCNYKSVYSKYAGLWICKKCSTGFIGNVYKFNTSTLW